MTDRGTTSASSIDGLLARHQIADVLLRYCRGVDRADEALLRSVYHPDAIDDHGSFSGSADEFVTYLMERSVGSTTVATQHAISNVLIELDGDEARVESYVLASHVRDDERGRRLETLGARYLDRFERRRGEWRIAHRLVVHDWSQVEALSDVFPNRQRFAAGVRGPADPSYESLGWARVSG